MFHKKAGGICVVTPDHLAPVLSVSLTEQVHNLAAAFRLGFKWGFGHSCGIVLVLVLVSGLKMSASNAFFESAMYYTQLWVGALLLFFGISYYRKRNLYLYSALAKLEKRKEARAVRNKLAGDHVFAQDTIDCVCCDPTLADDPLEPLDCAIAADEGKLVWSIYLMFGYPTLAVSHGVSGAKKVVSLKRVTTCSGHHLLHPCGSRNNCGVGRWPHGGF